MTFLFWVAAAAFALRFNVDDAFVDRLRCGDAAAFRMLVEKHHGALVGLAESIVRSRAIAEDVAQETWIAVMAGISGFDGRSALSSWVIAILINKARTAARKEGRYTGFEAPGDAGVIPPERFAADGHWRDPPTAFDHLDPERIVAGREMWRFVGEAIDLLPPAQKAVLILRDVEGRAGDETCALLGVTPANQRILLHRARARLRNEIEALLRRCEAPGDPRPDIAQP